MDILLTLPLEIVKHIFMNNRFVKIFHFSLMALALLAIIVFMVLHLCSGADTQMSKIYTLLYALLIIWAGIRVYSLGKDVFRK